MHRTTGAPETTAWQWQLLAAQKTNCRHIFMGNVSLMLYSFFLWSLCLDFLFSFVIMRKHLKFQKIYFKAKFYFFFFGFFFFFNKKYMDLFFPVWKENPWRKALNITCTTQQIEYFISTVHKKYFYSLVCCTRPGTWVIFHPNQTSGLIQMICKEGD